MADEELVLDTTYLLPIFGIDVRLKGFGELFPRLLASYAVLYNPVSLVEAKWIVLKLSGGDPSRKELLLKAYRLGLRALLSDRRLKQTGLTNPDVEEIADELLLKAGVKDYFDRVIFATAAQQGAILLTEDEELMKIGLTGIPRPKEVISWEKLIAEEEF